MPVDFTAMDGYELEDYISGLFRQLGFEVEETSYSNDGGVDLVATYNQPIFAGKYIFKTAASLTMQQNATAIAFGNG